MTIRSGALAALLLTLTLRLAAQDAIRELDNRYKIDYNSINYPHKTPQEGLKAVVKALDSGAYEYMLAHLIDPKFVDARVAEYKATMFSKEELRKEDEAIATEPDPKVRKKLEVEKEYRQRDRGVVAFGRLVKETRRHYAEDPVLLRELRLMARDGEWETDDAKGVCTLKSVPSRKVFFKTREGRWFMEERQQ